LERCARLTRKVSIAMGITEIMLIAIMTKPKFFFTTGTLQARP
jgi:hypothetical protein